MININVEGGTAKLGENLCTTCGNVFHAEMANGQEITKCNWVGKWLTSAVVRCTQYEHKNAPNLHSMKEIAWEIKADPKGKLGFAPPDRNKRQSLLDDII